MKAPSAVSSSATPGRGFLTAGWGLALVLACAAVVITWAGRDIAPIGDEWAWIQGAVHLDADAIIEDYNGHLLATTWSGYYALLHAFGLPQYWVFGATAVALHFAVAALVFVLARRRIGSVPALLPAAAVAFLGTGSDAFLSGLNLGLVAAIAGCLAALVMLDRGTPRADPAACALLLLGLASFTVAIAFTAGACVEILRRDDRLRRLWVVLVPTVAYGVWRLVYGGSLSGDVRAGSSGGGALDVVGNAFEAATGAVAGVAGVQLASPEVTDRLPWLDSLAQVVVGLGAVALLWLLARRRQVSPRLSNLLVTGAVLWLLIGLGRGSLDDLFASRYVYQGAIVVILIAVELAPGLAIQRRGALTAVALAVAGTVALNLVWMVVWGNHLRRESATARAQLAALDIARGRAAPGLRPSRDFRLAAVTAGGYYAAGDEFGGSPALTTAELRRASEQNREAADAVLARALGVRLVPGAAASGGAAPVVERPSGAAVATRRGCLTVTPTGPAATVELSPSSPSGVVFRTGAGGGILVAGRRFGDRFTVGIGAPQGRAGKLAAPLGRAPDPWHFRAGLTGRTRICAVRSGL